MLGLDPSFSRDVLDLVADEDLGVEVDEVVASLEFGDPTGGRGKDGKITKQLEELDEKGADEEPLKSAV